MPQQTVLLVEPDDDAAKRVQKILEQAGYRVITTGDSESAGSVLEYAQADVVLLAYPIGRRAVEDLPAIVRSSSRPLLPVVAMFPFPNRTLAQQALADGCVDVIPKPIDRLMLEDLLRVLLRPKPEQRSGPGSGLDLRHE